MLITWNWSHRYFWAALWMLGAKSMSYCRAAVILIAEPSLIPLRFLIRNIKLREKQEQGKLRSHLAPHREKLSSLAPWGQTTIYWPTLLFYKHMTHITNLWWGNSPRVCFFLLTWKSFETYSGAADKYKDFTLSFLANFLWSWRLM